MVTRGQGLVGWTWARPVWFRSCLCTLRRFFFSFDRGEDSFNTVLQKYGGFSWRPGADRAIRKHTGWMTRKRGVFCST